LYISGDVPKVFKGETLTENDFLLLALEMVRSGTGVQGDDSSTTWMCIGERALERLLGLVFISEEGEANKVSFLVFMCFLVVVEVNV
jgi:hypothetical protein